MRLPRLVPPPPRRRQPELMDDEGLARPEVDRALADLERVNRWLLGIGPVRRTLLPRLTPDEPRQLLVDLGTGSGQVPARLAAAARRRGVELAVVGVDRKLSHLLAGRRRGHRQHRIVADAAALPFADGAAHWSLSNLFFHHFDGGDNHRIVAEMARVARRGAAVVDLRRSRLAEWLFVAAARLLRLGTVARLDGRASVRGAWTAEEVERWASEALAGRAEVRRRLPFRWSLLVEPGEARDHPGSDRRAPRPS